MKHFIQAKLPLIYQSIAYIKYYKDFLRNKKCLWLFRECLMRNLKLMMRVFIKIGKVKNWIGKT